MDKPEEVKRFDLGQQVSIGTDKDFCKTVMIGVIEGKYVLFEDHAKALSAERANAEKRVESNRLYGYRDGMKESEEKITALEAKVKELEAEIEMLTDNGDPLI